MAVTYNEKDRTITIDTQQSSYQMKIGPFGILLHTYYGKRIAGDDMSYLIRYQDVSFAPAVADAGFDRTVSLDVLPQEFPGFNVGDYRIEGVRMQHGDGSYGLDWRYVTHRSYSGKYTLSGLPSMYEGSEKAETLEVVLKDKVKEVYATLYYGVFENLDLITRACVIENKEEKDAVLDQAVSMSLDFNSGEMDLLTFYGRHAMERLMERKTVPNGITAIGSTRGTSSHHYNPFLILCEKNAGEDSGICYGFHYVYSGNFLAQTERSQRDSLRFMMGIHPSKFRVVLEREKKFVLPEVVMSFSESGFASLSEKLHRAFRNNLCRGKFKNARRPVLINNWEATYFDFTGDKLISIAEDAAKLGIEMLVMDDGWFGSRNNDEAGLGDWFPNEEKLGMTVKELVDRVKEKGLQFGIWMEPEMVNENSQLYREHPDWAFAMPERKPARGRCQLVLDLGRKEVREYLYNRICSILDSADISYVKWDMNRSLSDVYSNDLPPERQGEASHRYVLGLYELLEDVTSRYPDILFEGCSGGGGRFDAGMLYYHPQIWCSDNTEAIERLKIQYGTSFGYPISAVGAHVSACPNHQNGRTTPLAARGVTAMAGTFGYELDINKMTEEEKKEVSKQVEAYKRYYELINRGTYYRLASPYSDEGFTAWEFVSPGQDRILVNIVMTQAQANGRDYIVKLKGISPYCEYYFQEEDKIYSSRALINGGILLPREMGEYRAYQFYFERV